MKSYAINWLRAIFSIAVTSWVVVAGNSAMAADFPTKPIKIVVGLPPGSYTDGAARVFAAEMQKTFKSGVLVENRPGAAGAIAAEAVTRAEPDGHTLLSAAFTLVISPFLQKQRFDVGRDLVPIAQTLSTSYILLVRPDMPVSTLPEFVDYVRKQRELNYASYGTGSGTHLAMVMLQNRANIKNIQHVQYKGGPEVLQALMRGDVDMAFDAVANVVELVRGGRLKAIALAGPEEKNFPGIKSIADTYPGFEMDSWQGIFAPAGTPDDVVKKLSADILRTLQEPEVRKWLESRGSRVIGSTPEQFRARVQSDLKNYEQLIRENNIRIE